MTKTEQVTLVMKHIDSHGIYAAADVEKWFKEAGLTSIKVFKGWTVTKKFVRDVEAGGGWTSFKPGVAINDGPLVLSYLMAHFKVTNRESFIGRGKQFHSDLQALLDALLERAPSHAEV